MHTVEINEVTLKKKTFLNMEERPCLNEGDEGYERPILECFHDWMEYQLGCILPFREEEKKRKGKICQNSSAVFEMFAVGCFILKLFIAFLQDTT